MLLAGYERELDLHAFNHVAVKCAGVWWISGRAGIRNDRVPLDSGRVDMDNRSNKECVDRDAIGYYFSRGQDISQPN